MKILFFGGTGFFGRSFENYLKKKNLNIFVRYVGSKSKKYKDFDNNLILPFNRLSKIKSNFYSHIIHCAHPSTNKGHISEAKRFNLAIKNTSLALKLCDQKNIKNFFYASSGIVYLNKNKKITEYSKISVNTNLKNYINSKIICEKMIKEFCKKKKINYTIIRFFSFSGKFQLKNTNYAIPNLINQFKNKKIKYVSIKGSGHDVRSFMHQEDLAKAILLICKLKNKKNIFNVGSDYSIKIIDLAKKIKKILRSSKKIKILEPKKKITFYVPNINKLKKAGFKNLISLNKLIKDLIFNYSINH